MRFDRTASFETDWDRPKPEHRREFRRLCATRSSLHATPGRQHKARYDPSAPIRVQRELAQALHERGFAVVRSFPTIEHVKADQKPVAIVSKKGTAFLVSDAVPLDGRDGVSGAVARECRAAAQGRCSGFRGQGI